MRRVFFAEWTGEKWLIGFARAAYGATRREPAGEEKKEKCLGGVGGGSEGGLRLRIEIHGS